MKKYTSFFILFFLMFELNAFSQNPKLENLSSDKNWNYTFGTIFWNEIIKKKLVDTAVVIIQQADPKATPEDYFEGYGGVLTNLLISLSNTGEFASSELYIIRGLNNPEVVSLERNLDSQKIELVIKYRNREGKIHQSAYAFDPLF